MPISCHFRDCKALLVTSLTSVSGAIASVQTSTFTFEMYSLVYIAAFLSDGATDRQTDRTVDRPTAVAPQNSTCPPVVTGAGNHGTLQNVN